eukprot:Nitzschia sp. Nitz4//scaffold11_size288233//177995//179215//NITZ4_000788-RA/size288233-snap-gene-0.54-mRNA-1//-1//CDS//3329534116//3015//frame0
MSMNNGGQQWPEMDLLSMFQVPAMNAANMMNMGKLPNNNNNMNMNHNMNNNMNNNMNMNNMNNNGVTTVSPNGLGLDDIFDDFYYEDPNISLGAVSVPKPTAPVQMPPPVPRQQESETSRLERKERNREHAKRSRLRKKFLLENLQEQVNELQAELDKFQAVIKREFPGDKAHALLKEVLGSKAPSDLGESKEGEEGNYKSVAVPSGFGPVKTLMEPDFRLVHALSGSQHNFCISDPTLPDNPIVFVSQGFLAMTGYTLDQVLGRNCRFLQGPDTDPSAVRKIRDTLEAGEDASMCLLNYKADGTPFWNQLMIASLRDADNNVVNYVGVQCEVSKAVVDKRRQEKEKGHRVEDGDEESDKKRQRTD